MSKKRRLWQERFRNWVHETDLLDIGVWEKLLERLIIVLHSTALAEIAHSNMAGSATTRTVRADLKWFENMELLICFGGSESPFSVLTLSCNHFIFGTRL